MNQAFRLALAEAELNRLQVAIDDSAEVMSVTLLCGHVMKCVNISARDRAKMVKGKCPTCCGVQ